MFSLWLGFHVLFTAQDKVFCLCMPVEVVTRFMHVQVVMGSPLLVSRTGQWGLCMYVQVVAGFMHIQV